MKVPYSGPMNPKVHADGVTVWDYRLLESLEEFKDVIADASVILAVDTKTEKMASVYGTELLRAVASGIIPEQHKYFVAFAIDLSSTQLEHLLAAVVVTKGFHEYEWGGAR